MSDFELKRLNVCLFSLTRNLSPWKAIRDGNEISVRHDPERPRLNGPRRTGEILRLPGEITLEDAMRTIGARLQEETVNS